MCDGVFITLWMCFPKGDPWCCRTLAFIVPLMILVACCLHKAELNVRRCLRLSFVEGNNTLKMISGSISVLGPSEHLV